MQSIVACKPLLGVRITEVTAFLPISTTFKKNRSSVEIFGYDFGISLDPHELVVQRKYLTLYAYVKPIS